MVDNSKNIVSLRNIWLLLVLLFVFKLQANVVITEVMQSNFGGVIDYYNEFPDSWVEVHNESDHEIDIKGYSISYMYNIKNAYVLPESLIIPADGYTLIYCDKENIKQHTNFRLNSNEPGTVYLWDNNGIFQDSLHYPEMISPEVSYGRLCDYPDSLSHFRISTPGCKNNDTNTESILKKVDFSVKGGVKKEAFYLKLSLKGDFPSDAVIRYTTDGKEPTFESKIFEDSLLISNNTVIRAKPFSDSAISKISKTQTYIFDKQNKMPIISIVCDSSYLFGDELGIMSSSTDYADSHPDNYFYRYWIGDENYMYDWRRPINIEYFSGDSLCPDFNQLSETRVGGNGSRPNSDFQTLVLYANKRFGEKHFNGAFWNHLKPNADKQKSMMLRTYRRLDNTYCLKDMLCQISIGRFAKFYDVDYQAERNVQVFVNGHFQRIMHLQERADEDFFWANYNTSDIEYIETKDGLYDNRVNNKNFPNYYKFMNAFQSPDCTYQMLDNMLDINSFMNYVSTQAFFVNRDYPYNNTFLWYDQQGTKKWRFVLKDLDATLDNAYHSYYNFLLRVEPFEYLSWCNTENACELYQKIFSFEKFKQPFIDRTCVLAGTIFSKNSMHYMLDSIVGDMSLSLTQSELKEYTKNIAKFYEWIDNRHDFYYSDLGDFFELGDTVKLTINSLSSDSMIYFNNNPLVEDKYEGYFFANRYMYLSHNNDLDIYGLNVPETDEISYLEMEQMIKTKDSTATRWTVSYMYENQYKFEHYINDNLYYKIPVGARNVKIIDGYEDEKYEHTSVSLITSHSPENLFYMVYSLSGVFLGKFNYEEICEYNQIDQINIVVAVDSNNQKVYTFKLLKE